MLTSARPLLCLDKASFHYTYTPKQLRNGSRSGQRADKVNLVPRSLGYEINFCLESVQKAELRALFIYSYCLL